MAIKGSLSEITFVELLRVVGKHNGKLRVWNFPDGKQYECYFYNQSVVNLSFCGKSVASRDAVKELFFELLMDGKSYYLFEEVSPLPTENIPLVSVAELLDFSIFETIETNDELLPHINTRFETVNKIDFALQGELSGFWRDTIRFLHKGCSAYELCVELGLEEKFVRQSLYRLRTTGLIKPVRMFSTANSLAKARMLRQKSVNAANAANDAQKINTVTSGKITEAIAGELKAQSESTGNTFQNISSSNNQPQIPQSNQAQKAPASDGIVPPEFLLKSLQPLPLSEPKSSVNGDNARPLQEPPVNNLILQKPPVNNPVNLQNNPPVTEIKASELSPLFNMQIAADDLPTHSVNISVNSQHTANEKPQAEYENFPPPKRSNLIKRMLNSLFRG